MGNPYRFKIVQNDADADFDAVRVTLFLGDFGICGWYIGPTSSAPIADGYIPKSANLLAASAILRAAALAERLGIDVCIIDPDDLWPRLWSEP